MKEVISQQITHWCTKGQATTARRPEALTPDGDVTINKVKYFIWTFPDEQWRKPVWPSAQWQAHLPSSARLYKNGAHDERVRVEGDSEP